MKWIRIKLADNTEILEPFTEKSSFSRDGHFIIYTSITGTEVAVYDEKIGVDHCNNDIYTWDNILDDIVCGKNLITITEWVS